MNMTATQEIEVAYRPVPLECRVRLLQSYHDLVKPYEKIKYDIYCLTIPTITIFPDGRIEHNYNFTEAQKETLRLVDEAIEHCKRASGLVPNE